MCSSCSLHLTAPWHLSHACALLAAWVLTAGQLESVELESLQITPTRLGDATGCMDGQISCVKQAAPQPISFLLLRYYQSYPRPVRTNDLKFSNEPLNSTLLALLGVHCVVFGARFRDLLPRHAM